MNDKYPPNGINFPCIYPPFKTDGELKQAQAIAIKKRIDEACNLIGAINATVLPLVRQLIAQCDEWHAQSPSLQMLHVINDLEAIKAKVLRSEELRKNIKGAK